MGKNSTATTMTFWRAAGLNYVQYSSIAAKAVRAALKPAGAELAGKRAITSIRYTGTLVHSAKVQTAHRLLSRVVGLTSTEHFIELLADPDERCPLGHLLQLPCSSVSAGGPDASQHVQHGSPWQWRMTCRKTTSPSPRCPSP